MSSQGQIPTRPRYDVQKAYPVPFRAATWTGIVRRCQWKVHNCSKRSFDTKTWPTAPGSARDKFCPDSPRPSSHVKRPRKIQLCFAVLCLRSVSFKLWKKYGRRNVTNSEPALLLKSLILRIYVRMSKLVWEYCCLGWTSHCSVTSLSLLCILVGFSC